MATAANPLRDEFRMHRVPGSCAVVIFGGLGDLAGRKLVPALYNLYLRRLLPAGFAMIGIGRTDPGGDEGYRQALRERCSSFSRTAVTDPEWGGIVDPPAGSWFARQALQLAQLAVP